MASKTSKPAPTNDIPQADIEAELAKHGLTSTGRIAVSTNITVEDRTEKPEDVIALEYESEDVTLDNGIVLTTYGNAKAA